MLTLAQLWASLLDSYSVRLLCLPLCARSNLAQGSVNIMRYGAGSNGVMRTLGQYMVGSGATFGYIWPHTLCISLLTLFFQILHVDR